MSDTNPHAYPPLVSRIAQTILLENEKLRVRDRRVLHESGHQIEAWAERMILAGPSSYREHVLREEAYRVALAVYRTVIESVKEAIGR